MTQFFNIFLPVAAGLLLLFVFLKFVAGRLKKGLIKEIGLRYGSKEIIKYDIGANLFGFKSKGLKQVRGNGALILFKNEVCFLMAVPRREHIIPLKNITELNLTKSFLSKTRFNDLLQINFEENGKADECAFAVVNPESWIEIIERQRSLT